MAICGRYCEDRAGSGVVVIDVIAEVESGPQRKNELRVPDYLKVTAAVIEKNGKVLIARRKAGRFAGKWEFPGGKVEAGETHEECLRRELREELGVEAHIGPFVTSNVHGYPHATVELLAYRAEIVGGEFLLSDHDEIRWVSPQDLDFYDFPAADKPIIKVLKTSHPHHGDTGGTEKNR